MGLEMIYSLSIMVFVAVICQCGAYLDANYYEKTCPQAEKIISQAVRNAALHDPKVPARILRMFFHDCFIRVRFNYSSFEFHLTNIVQTSSTYCL